MWSTAHGYYSTGAGHSVALKQFSPSSCIQELLRKETYLLTKNICYTKHIYTALMYVQKEEVQKNVDGKFLHDMLVNWLYSGIRTLLFLWWGITVEPVLKGNCIERPPKNSLNKQFIPTKCIHCTCVSEKMWYPIPKNISAVKNGEAKLLDDLKVWNHCEAKKKRYTGKAV